MAWLTRSRVSGRTLGWALSTRETVWWETPASAATSLIAGGRTIPFIGCSSVLLAELARAVARGLRGGDDPGADPVRVEHLDGGDRGATGRRHPFPQDRGVVAGLGGERRRTLDGGDGELGRQVPAQSEQHARLGHRVDQVERVRRSRPGDRGDRVEVLLRHTDHEAGRGEHLLDEHEVALARVRAGGDGARALPDDGRRV